MRMTLQATRIPCGWGALFVGIVAALAILAVVALPSTSRADVWGGKLAAKSWATDGHVYALEAIFAKVDEGPSAICVGPVTESLTFPYGWSCGQYSIEWDFTPIWAAGGVDNPNSSADTFTSSNW